MTSEPVEWLSAEDAHAALVARYLALEDHRKQVELEQFDIKARLRELGVGFHRTAAGSVSISPNRRFNADHARDILPAELVAMCTKPVLDPRTAKAKLPPDLYAACMVEVGDPVVRIL